MAEEARVPGLARNLISNAGVIIAIVAIANLGFLIHLDSTQSHGNPYLGIMTWLIAPAILIFGLVLYLGGMLYERRRRRHLAPNEVPEYPRIDFNERRTRIIVVSSAIGLMLFVTMTAVGSYQVYHYTESDAFCGTMCHQVMIPEYTAYKQSPHARVGCVGCHVGGGAKWYVRSKVSGSHQLYSLLTQKYPRPIPTPVRNMRPAQETCEQCHWPEKFFGTQLKVFDHFGYDETNTLHEVRLLMNTGGGSPAGGPAAGIHWHMKIANKVTYIATDDHRQEIPWVRIEDRQGHVTEYVAEGSKLTAPNIATAEKRRMDCVDCHSRPTHIYVSPDRAVDRAMLAGTIDKTLPYVKQQSVAVLAKDYSTTPDAVRAIAAEIPAYYQKTYPDVFRAKKAGVDATVVALQNIFTHTRFPEMRVDWRTHRDNIGHLTSLGCFRCHDDQHVSKDGKRISKECNVCHTVLSENQKNAQFEHPVDLGDLRAVNCADCHTGGGM